MKYFTQRLKHQINAAIIGFVLLIGCVSTANAQGLEGYYLASINRNLYLLSNFVVNYINAYTQTSKNKDYHSTYDVNTSIKDNYSQSISKPVLDQDINNNAKKGLLTTFTTTDPTPLMRAMFYNIPGDKKELDKKYRSFSFNDLLSNSRLTSKKARISATNYITYASGLATPFQAVLPTKIIPTLPDAPEYRAALGSYAARQSIGLSNLLHIYSQRTPIQGIGRIAPVAVDKHGNVAFGPFSHRIDNPSSLQIAQFNNERRANSPKWYKKMEVASSTTLQREQLYVLAAIQKELFEARIQRERLIATVSALELQINDTLSKPKLRAMQAAMIKAAAARKLQSGR